MDPQELIDFCKKWGFDPVLEDVFDPTIPVTHLSDKQVKEVQEYLETKYEL